MKNGFSILVLITFGALAVSANTSTTTTTETTPPAAEKILGASISIIGKSSLHSPDDYSRSASTDVLISPWITIAGPIRLGALAVYSRDFENREEPNSVSNTKLVLSHNAIELAPKLKLSPAIAARLPTNREAREDDTYAGGFGIEPKLTLELRRLLMTYRLALTKNVHELTHDRNGSANISWSQAHLLGLNYQLSDRVSVGLSGEYAASRTYRDFSRSRFDLSEVINVDVGQGFSFDIGHSNSGDALKPNLSDSNIAFYDDEGSIVYLGVNYVY